MAKGLCTSVECAAGGTFMASAGEISTLAVTMKMTSSTRTISTIGVTLIPAIMSSSFEVTAAMGGTPPGRGYAGYVELDSTKSKIRDTGSALSDADVSASGAPRRR